jgi:hypothetical protein
MQSKRRTMTARNRFLIDLEIPLREMVDLAMAKWIAAHRAGANDPALANLTDHFLEQATRREVCWTIASMAAQGRRVD